MRNYNHNWGKFLLFRWLVASWLLHGVHVFDKTEKQLYILCELLIVAVCCVGAYLIGCRQWCVYLIIICVIHTITWLTDSHWLVGFREVDKHFKGKGIISTLSYIDRVGKSFSKDPNVEAVLVYGSMSRRMYHDRSDLDLRIWQDRPSLQTFLNVQKYRFIGIWKYKIPLDLKLVDSMEYLKREMRPDEKAIVAYSKDHKPVWNTGFELSELQAAPESFLKKNNPEWIAKNKYK